MVRGWDPAFADLVEYYDQLTPREGRDWDKLTDAQKDEEDLKMAVYAAMIDRVDQNLSSLFTKLKELDEWDNTLILFFSDNGACSEQPNTAPDIPPGPVESYRTVSVEWANASTSGGLMPTSPNPGQPKPFAGLAAVSHVFKPRASTRVSNKSKTVPNSGKPAFSNSRS